MATLITYIDGKMGGRGQIEKKEKWVKPKLIILTRGKPEEDVMTACKTGGTDGPAMNQDMCRTYDPPMCSVVCAANVST